MNLADRNAPLALDNRNLHHCNGVAVYGRTHTTGHVHFVGSV